MAFGKRDTLALGRSMKSLDFTGRLGGVACPALVLCGAKDGANLASAKYLARHIMNAGLRILPDTGHVVNEERPEALAEILTEFYRALDTPAGGPPGDAAPAKSLRRTI